MEKKDSIFKKLILSYFLIILFVLTVVTIYLTNIQTRQVKSIVDKDIQTISMSLSINPLILECFTSGELSNEVKVYLDELNDKLQYIDYIVLVDTNSLRLYHPYADLIGKHFQGGDETPALEGAEPYITDGFGTTESQRRAFRTIYDKNGEILGFIMVSASANSIMLLQNDEIVKYFSIFLFALLVGILLLSIFSKNLYKSLLGFEPSKLSSMFLQREDVLETLSEGLLLVDIEGNCEYKNPSAERLLKSGNEAADLKELIPNFIENNIRPRLNLPLPIVQESVSQGEQFLLMDLFPILKKNQIKKILVILNDQTENMRLAEELTGVKHILEKLRKVTHEHRNKLHVIIGLLKTGQTEEAITFITNSVIEDDDNLLVTEIIRDKTVAALIIGKKRCAKELNIDFNLLKGSVLEENNPYLPSLLIVTIIGNLLENSFEAIHEKTSPREVSLYINSSKDGLSIIVDDTGHGMDQDTAERIQKTNYSTKGEGHGTGFSLIRNIIKEYGGLLEIESEPESGSSISITFKKMEG